MKFKNRSTVSLVIGIVVFSIIIVFIIKNHDFLKIISQLSLCDFIVSILIASFAFTINGGTISYLAKQQFGIRINPVDLFLLPVMMNLWGYILPFRGGMIFSVFFLKLKYRLRVSEGVTIGTYICLISLTLTGFWGLYYLYYFRILSIWGVIISLGFIVSPLIVWFVSKALKTLLIGENVFLKTTKVFFVSIVGNLKGTFLDHRISFVIFLLTLLSISVHTMWIYWATLSFGFEISFIKIVMFSLILRLSLIVKILPGNLGVQELISGGVLFTLGGELETGLLIALFIRFSTLLITFTIGIFGVLLNMKYFKVGDIKALWALFKQNQNNKEESI